MSAKLMGQVWDLDLPHGELWVLMAICDHADHDGTAYPGLELLEYKTGYSERQIRRIIDSLELQNILIKSGGGIGRGRMQTYSIRLENAPHKKRTKRPVIEPIKADIMAAKNTVKADIVSQEKRTFPSLKADISDAPSYKEEPLREPCTASPSASRQSDPFFEKFKTAYESVYGCPYQYKQADFVQLAKTKKQINPSLTDWQRAVDHYLASEIATHTLADLAVRFGTFYRSALDRFNKPVLNGATSIEKPKREYTGLTWATMTEEQRASFRN